MVDWIDASKELTRRNVFMSLYGDTGSGRTTLALTAPGPIALIHTTEKLEGIVQKAAKDGKIIKMIDVGGNFEGTVDEMKKYAGDKVAMAREAWFDAFNWARTIVIDNQADLWTLFQLAWFGTQTPKGRSGALEWGPLNTSWTTMLKYKRFDEDNNTNIIMIGLTDKEYIKSAKGMSEATGRTIYKGQKSVPTIADVWIRTHHDFRVNEFTSTIEKGWWNSHNVDNKSFEGPMSNFPDVMSLITEMDASEWGES